MGVNRLTDTILGSIVTLVTAPFGLGAALGGWLAGRHAGSVPGGALAGAFVGIVGAVPWAGLVYLASAGAIKPIGYHEGPVHIGINTASPDTLVFWQELALAGTVGAVILGAAIVGGALAGTNADVVGEVRTELSQS